ncbi:MAG TPA: DUF5666 domain-containing protein [Thermoanaerobaculia bacterium]|nr:DUF5666 domain-containing protein [Thermoanaerobaculia bacterium]
MKRKPLPVVKVVVIVAVMLVLSGCRREGQDVTGSYGSGVLTGSVALNGIEGSPEGVEVSVRGTGMTATLGADGRFAFAGVPEGAILDFRRGDGIQASLAVNDAGRGSIVVELGRSGASKGSGRGNSGKDKRELEGVIRTAGADSLVLFTSHQEEVTIGLTAETVIRRGNELLTAADLTADMRVHVRAKKVEDTYTALLVIVQEGEDDGGDGEERPQLREYEGTIVSVSATELVVLTSKKVEATFLLTADTVIRKGNTTVAPADLLPGQRVHVKALEAEDAKTAVQVTLQNTRDADAVTVSGDVVSVAGGVLTVATRGGQVTVQTDAATRIRKKGKTITVGEILAGDSISAKGRTISENTILASEVEVRGKSGRP